MKKSTKATKATKATKEAPARVACPWLSSADALASKVETENKVEFDLVAKEGVVPSVTLTIYPTDMEWDNAILNLYGVSIRCVIRGGKNGMFLSLPSQKGKDGNYYDLVKVYDKGFYSLVNEVLAAYYGDEAEADA